MKKFLNRSEKGFTLIELLVVIAIIAILSTIVLASLGTARDRAQIAKIKGQLSQIPAAAELYSDAQAIPSYGTAGTACGANMFADATSGMLRLTGAAALPSGATIACASDPAGWAVMITYKTLGYCVDSKTNVVASKTSGAFTITALGGCI